MMELTVAASAEISKLRLAPGDLLVMKMDCLITEEMASTIKRQMDPLLPVGVKMVIIDRHMSLSVVTTDDPLGIVGR